MSLHLEDLVWMAEQLQPFTKNHYFWKYASYGVGISSLFLSHDGRFIRHVVYVRSSTVEFSSISLEERPKVDLEYLRSLRYWTYTTPDAKKIIKRIREEYRFVLYENFLEVIEDSNHEYR